MGTRESSCDRWALELKIQKNDILCTVRVIKSVVSLSTHCGHFYHQMCHKQTPSRCTLQTILMSLPPDEGWNPKHLTSLYPVIRLHLKNFLCICCSADGETSVDNIGKVTEGFFERGVWNMILWWLAPFDFPRFSCFFVWKLIQVWY